MAGRGMRIAVVVGSVLTAVALVGLAAYLSRQDLGRAAKLATVLSVLLNTAGVAIAIAGIVLSARLGRGPRSPRIRQSIQSDEFGAVVAKRAQRAHGGDGDVEQEISGRGASRIDASDAQSVGRDDV